MPSTCERLAGHKLRCTTQRQALYEALAATDSHPTAEELYRWVKARTNRLSRATVYNTLETLCRAGLARKLPSDGCYRSDPAVSDHMHLCPLDDGSNRAVPPAAGDTSPRSTPPPTPLGIGRRLGVEIEGVNIQLLARRSAG